MRSVFLVLVLCFFMADQAQSQTYPEITNIPKGVPMPESTVPGYDLVQRQAEKDRQNNNRSVDAIIQMFRSADSSEDVKGLFKPLELTKQQLRRMRELSAEYNADLKKIPNRELDKERFRNHDQQVAWQLNELERKLRNDINSLLLPHQLAELANLDIIRKGAAKVVTGVILADYLELSDSKRDKIKERSDKLAKKIEAFIRESRQEAFDIIAEELDGEQLDKLYALYGEKKIKDQIGDTKVDSLYSQYLFTRPDDHDLRYDPMVYLIRTKILDKKSREKK